MKTISILVLLLVSGLSYSQKELNWDPPMERDTHLDPLDIKLTILSSGIQHPDIVYAQARLETGNFTSSAYRDKHNIFGFSRGGERMSFKDDYECILYYYEWQLKYYKGGDYYTFLECLYKTKAGRCVRYATDPDYIKKLKQFK